MSEHYSRVNRMVSIRHKKEKWVEIIIVLEKVRNVLLIMNNKLGVAQDELDQLNLIISHLYDEIA